MALSAHLDCRPDAEEDEEETEHHQDDHPSQAEVVLSRNRVCLDGGVAEPPANLGVVDPLDKVDLDVCEVTQYRLGDEAFSPRSSVSKL